MRPWPGSGIHEIQAWVQGQQPNSPEEAAALVEGLQQKSGRPGLQVRAAQPGSKPCPDWCGRGAGGE